MSKRTSLFVSGGDLCRPECRLKEGEESVVSRSSAVAQQKGCNAHASPQNNSTKTFLSAQLFYMSRNPVIEFEVYHPGKVWPTLTIVRKEPCLSKVQGGLCCGATHPDGWWAGEQKQGAPQQWDHHHHHQDCLCAGHTQLVLTTDLNKNCSLFMIHHEL